MYEIGSSPFFTEITPGVVSDPPERETTEEDATVTPVTMLSRQPDEREVVLTTSEPRGGPEEWDQFPTETPAEYRPKDPEAETTTPGSLETETEEPDQLETEHPESETGTPIYTQPTNLNPSEPESPEQTRTANPISEPSQPINTIPEGVGPRYPPAEPRSREPDPTEPSYTNPGQVVPPYARPRQPQIVVVDEDEDLDVNGTS